MNTKGQHPEDAIYKAKTFINELQKVQNKYFDELCEALNLNEEGKDYLFDYIYNELPDSHDGFDCYLMDYKREYSDMLNTPSTDPLLNGLETTLVLGDSLANK